MTQGNGVFSAHGNGSVMGPAAVDATASVRDPDFPDLESALGDLSDDRVRALRDEIARRSMSLQALESLAQELPIVKRDSGDDVDDSMLHTDVVGLGDGASATLDPKVRDKREFQQHNPKRDSSASKSSRESVYDHQYINQFIQKGLSDSVGSNTSKVIAGLQNTIDTLRRELKDQNAKYIEAKKGRDAMAKRCDNQNESMESLKHQNEMLNTMIQRKERQIQDVEGKMAVQKSRAQTLEQDHADNEARMLDMEERTAAAENKFHQLHTASDAAADGYRRKEQFLRAEFAALQASIAQISATQTAEHKKEDEWRQGIVDRLAREELLRSQIRQHQLDFERLAAERELKVQQMLAEFRDGIDGHGSTVDGSLQKMHALSEETSQALEMLKKSQRSLVAENEQLKAQMAGEDGAAGGVA